MKSHLKHSRGFTLIELMVVIVIIGILVAIALPNFVGAQDRAKISSVKANMHTVQTMIETYSVDWGGAYPAYYTDGSTGGLKAEAEAKGYYKSFKNPVTQLSGSNQEVMDTSPWAVNPTTGVVATAMTRGAVLYDHGNGNRGATAPYYIYGMGLTDNAVILDKGRPFILTNSTN